MKSHVTKQFSALYARLPTHVQRQADDAYEQFKRDPNHPSLHFKPVQQMPGVFSARVSGNWRVLGRMRSGEIYWFWIGTHAEYTQIIP